ENPSNMMFLLTNGTATRAMDGEPSTTVSDGVIFAATDLMWSPTGPRETLTAISVCCILTLHRHLLIALLKKHPEVKRHFEDVARREPEMQAMVHEHAANIYSMPFFKDCGGRFLYLLDLHLESHIFFSDEAIVEEGFEGEDMYIMYAGTADVQ
ncbi:unnamed protein product, partial [Polarella glacialis]